MGRGSMEKSTDMGWQCQHEGITVPTAMQTGAPRPEWLGRGCKPMRSMHCRMAGDGTRLTAPEAQPSIIHMEEPTPLVQAHTAALEVRGDPGEEVGGDALHAPIPGPALDMHAAAHRALDGCVRCRAAIA